MEKERDVVGPASKKRKVLKYNGYTFPPNNGTKADTDDRKIDVVFVVENTEVEEQEDASGSGDPVLTVKQFHNRYVAKRRPCIVRSSESHPTAAAAAVPILSAQTVLQHIVQHDADRMVQVEHRDSILDHFGRNQKVTMPLSEFVQECCGCQMLPLTEPSLASADDSDTAASSATPAAVSTIHTCDKSISCNKKLGLYYMSTQDPDKNGRSDRKPTAKTAINQPPSAVFGAPCDTLLKTGVLPSTLPIAGHLKLHMCNMWMGSSASAREHSIGGVSPDTPRNPPHSGLHHDFHDNFYLLVAGRKQVRLWSPADAGHLALAGTIDTIHPNGLISYRSNPTRADGVPCVPVMPVPLSLDDAIMSDEEEVNMFGKGFDYQTSGDEEDSSSSKEVVNASFAYTKERDDFKCEDAASDEASVETDDDSKKAETILTLPDHFSFIDPTQKTASICETFPTYSKALQAIANIQSGDCLYLPAGWFHCVSSSGIIKDSLSERTSGVVIPYNIHLAVNFWYHPPDNSVRYEHPYHDLDFWGDGKHGKSQPHNIRT